MCATSTPAAAGADGAPAAPRVVVGGVGQLWQGDLDLGRLAVERLAADDLGPGVAVEDLSYGAVHASWRLEELAPAALIVIGAEMRGRRPGTVERRAVTPPVLPHDELQAAVGDALTGYLSIDLLLEVGAGFSALPERTVVVEVEPATREPSTELSPACAAALRRALDLVRAEVRDALAAAARAP